MYRVSWNEFETLSYEISKKIKSSRIKIDLIICVSRGGLLLGRELSEMLGLPLGVISAKFVNNEYLIDKTISSLHKVEGNILLVDDIFEETAFKISDVIKKNRDVKKVYFACVFYKSISGFTPDFYINKIKRDLWISFPYQIYN